nr:MAG TPA: hypothetical protein [Caudoviricetes sp.]
MYPGFSPYQGTLFNYLYSKHFKKINFTFLIILLRIAWQVMATYGK